MSALLILVLCWAFLVAGPNIWNALPDVTLSQSGWIPCRPLWQPADLRTEIVQGEQRWWWWWWWCNNVD